MKMSDFTDKQNNTFQKTKTSILIIFFIMGIILTGCGGGRSDGLSVSPYNSGNITGFIYTRISSRTAAAVPTGHMPLVGANVICSNVSGITNSTGKFILSNVPSGTHTCTISKSGYGTITFNVTVVPGETVIALPEGASETVMVASATGTLQVTSVPTGGTIIIDEAVTGLTTNSSLNSLAVGGHEILVSLAGYESVSGQNITVNAGSVVSASFTLVKTTTAISISSGVVSLEVGGTKQLSAICTYADSSTGTCTSSLTWNSSSSSVATISATGLLTAVSPGTTTITASRIQSSVTSTGITVTVSCPDGKSWYQGSCQSDTLQSITLSPASVSVQIGAVSAAIQAVCVWTIAGQGTCPALTWISANIGIASVSNQGVITGIAAGNTTVHASTSGKSSNNVSVTVSTVPNQSPTATAQSDVTSGTAPLTVQFTGSGSDTDGTIVSYSWDFGDGSPTSSQQSPSHQYTSAGTYTATLAVTDDDGATGQHAVSIVVSGTFSTIPVVATGEFHTCGLTSGGTAKCWGDNLFGALGDGTSTDRYVPVNVIGLNTGIVDIVAGENWFNCALTESGGIMCWGDNGYGQLGDGTTTSRDTPVSVIGLTSGVTAISAGMFNTCAVTSSGGLKCWGNASFGLHGDGTNADKYTTPNDITGLTSGITTVSAGAFHTCALTVGGGVKCWGRNNFGQMGNDTTSGFVLSPVGNVIGLTSGVISVSAGYQHSCALSNQGSVKCWGWNQYGQLGDGTWANRYTPVTVSGLTSGVIAVSAGRYHSCAVTNNGGVKCWGRNHFGQLGDGTLTDRITPVSVSGLTSGVVSVSAGSYHTCAVMSNGGLKCWGGNEGMLGDDTTTPRLTPVNVIGF